MKSVVWWGAVGDEGKGKVVDYLAGCSITLRVREAQRGHTVIIGRNRYVLQLIPCGNFAAETAGGDCTGV